MPVPFVEMDARVDRVDLRWLGARLRYSVMVIVVPSPCGSVSPGSHDVRCVINESKWRLRHGLLERHASATRRLHTRAGEKTNTSDEPEFNAGERRGVAGNRVVQPS